MKTPKFKVGDKVGHRVIVSVSNGAKNQYGNICILYGYRYDSEPVTAPTIYCSEVTMIAYRDRNDTRLGQ